MKLHRPLDLVVDCIRDQAGRGGGPLPLPLLKTDALLLLLLLRLLLSWRRLMMNKFGSTMDRQQGLAQ